MTLAGLVAVGSLPLTAVSSTPSCLLRPWLQIIPLNVLFGLLFGKTWRIHRLLNNKQLKAIKVKESAVFFVAFLLTLPEIAIHGLYFLLAAPTLSEKTVLNEFTFVDVCASNSSYKRIFDSLHLVYGAFILILGCYVAQKSAALTTLFNEVKQHARSLPLFLILSYAFSSWGNMVDCKRVDQKHKSFQCKGT